MDKPKLCVIILILFLFLGASPASGSSISFLVETTPTVTIGATAYTPAGTSAEHYAGYAYNPGEGSSGSPVSGNATGYPGSARLGAAQTWLTTMEASTNTAYASYLKLQGTSPDPLGGASGFISQTATTVLDYTWDHQNKQILSFSASPIYEYFLQGDSSSNYFYALTDTLSITLTYYRGDTGASTVLATWNVVHNAVANSVTDPISDFTTGFTSFGSPLTWSGKITDNSVGDHLYVNITATQSGYSSFSVPVPASAFLMGTGLFGLGLLGFRRRGRRA
jgi:hypothetical protein